uniref:Uncharacterized protein n=1 Tax=Acrobeloides nanus TaxID=290746 RepID=A0A914DWE8_9BILA
MSFNSKLTEPTSTLNQNAFFSYGANGDIGHYRRNFVFIYGASTESQDIEIGRWMKPLGPEADAKWDIFIQSLKVRERDEYGLPQGLGCPEAYGPSGFTLSTPKSSIFQDDLNKNPASELRHISPSQTYNCSNSSEGSPNAIYAIAQRSQVSLGPSTSNGIDYNGWMKNALAAIKFYSHFNILHLRFEFLFRISVSQLNHLPNDAVAVVNRILLASHCLVDKFKKKDVIKSAPHLYDQAKHIRYNQEIALLQSEINKYSTVFESIMERYIPDIKKYRD